MAVDFERDFDMDLDADESLAPTPVRFKYKGRRYEMRPADTDQALKWRAATMEKMAPNPNGEGLIPISGFHDNEALILSMTVYDVTEATPEKAKRVPLPIIRTWPYPITEPLALRAKKMSGLITQPDTVEKVEAAIEELQAKLAELKKNREENPDAVEGWEGNSPDGTGGASESPTS